MQVPVLKNTTYIFFNYSIKCKLCNGVLYIDTQ